jgi:hypothetical protein
MRFAPAVACALAAALLLCACCAHTAASSSSSSSSSSPSAERRSSLFFGASRLAEHHATRSAGDARAARRAPRTPQQQHVLEHAHAHAHAHGSASAPRYPLVFMPALTGSRLESKLSAKTADHWYCPHTHDWRTMWWNELDFLPLARECWAAEMAPVCDARTGLCTSAAHVDVRAPDWGALGSVLYLDDAHKVPCFAYVYGNLSAAFGYDASNTYAAPYDWRLGPAQFNDSLTRTRELVEQASAAHNGEPVVLVSLSMGSPYTALFLSDAYTTPAWRARYVRAWVSLSGVFGGSTDATLALLALEVVPGFTGDMAKLMRSVVRGMGSVVWLLPNTAAFDDSQVWVSTPARNYTTRDTRQLLIDAGMLAAGAVFDATAKWTPMAAPLVETYCMYGTDVVTPWQLVYNTTASFDVPSAITGTTGDGVVADASLRVCDGWAAQQTQPVHAIRVPTMTHDDAVGRADAIANIVAIFKDILAN